VVKSRCVFLDRDGVINFKPPHGEYLQDWSEFRLIPGIVDWIRIFNTLNFPVIVVTNQRCVAKGIVPARRLVELHTRMVQELASLGAQIDDIFCCTHEENTCLCRKPHPGLLLQAADKWNIDLAQSVFIGDSDRDEQAAAACRVNFIGVETGRITKTVLVGEGPCLLGALSVPKPGAVPSEGPV